MAKIELNGWTEQPYSERYYEILEKRKVLPAWRHKQEFLEAFSDKQCLIVVGETGSGKSTQIPQFILEADNPRNMRIACTEPRKVAAISLSRRVADEMDVTIGEEVGYKVRFEDCTSHRTVLNFLTDGKLLREAMTDPLLKAYNVIILDEAHERTVSTDILFAHLKKLLVDRDDLKLVVMSATLEADKFHAYFGASKILKIPGKLYPVDIVYVKEPVHNYLRAAISTVMKILQDTTKGDILVFLTGQSEIEEVCCKIKCEAAVLGRKISPVKLVPLYSSLPPDLQQEAFEPARLPSQRKVVVSTNIAETSLTIDGIVYVVDCGLSKQKFYDPEECCESLLVSPISKASAHQRSGRAGRTQPGTCYRLYTKNSFEVDLQQVTIPEILRSKLDNTVLVLKKLGIDNLVLFDYLDPPPPQSLMRAVEVLLRLQALDADGNMTKLGKSMCQFPVDPQMAKMLLASFGYECVDEILSIAAMLSVPDFLTVDLKDIKASKNKPDLYDRNDGDHLWLLGVYQAYIENKEDPSWCTNNFINPRAMESVENVRQQLEGIMEGIRGRLDIPKSSTVPGDKITEMKTINIKKAILTGYFLQVAYEEVSGSFRTMKGYELADLHIPNFLPLVRQWVIYNEFTKIPRGVLRTLTAIDVLWLLQYYNSADMQKGEAKDAIELQELMRSSVGKKNY